MGFNNPNMPWTEVERLLSGGRAEQRGKDGRAPGSPAWNGGGDGPALSRKRQPYEPDSTQPHWRPDPVHVPYAELHCHSNFSFLDGASHPEQLVEEAARLGLEALALTDHNGFYGVVRFAEAARAMGLPTVFGTEITLTPGVDGRRARSEADTQRQVNTGLVPHTHAPDPHGRHLVVLAEGPDGYGRLARALSLGHLAGEKGVPLFGLPDIADAMPLTDRSFYVHGKKPGTTQISAYDSSKNLVGTFEVEVGQNTNRLAQELRKRLPGEVRENKPTADRGALGQQLVPVLCSLPEYLFHFGHRFRIGAKQGAG